VSDVANAGATPSLGGALLQDIVGRITSRFLVPPNEDELLSDFNAHTASVREPYAEIAKAFKSNISGLLSTVSFPYALASAATTDRHFQRIHSAERIRAQNLEASTGERREQLEDRRRAVALETAMTRMRSFMASKEGQDAMSKDLLEFLERALRQSDLSLAADELLLQGLVLAWGALEVLARDVFVVTLNRHPQAVEKLLADPTSKRRFELSKVSLETLARNDFDLSGKMGSLLSEQQDLSDLVSIKAVYGALYPDATMLREALGDDDLRVLGLRRHLVVHRRGLVDDAYKKATNCSQPLGERLRIAPDEVERHVQSATRAASAVLKEAVASE
jgi:hypothetical protein